MFSFCHKWVVTNEAMLTIGVQSLFENSEKVSSALLAKRRFFSLKKAQ